MAWRKRWPALDANVDRVGYWFAFLSLVWGGMSYIASAVTPLAGYGWGTFVFAGLGAACVLSLVLSVALVAWRYFNPLPPPAAAATFEARDSDQPPPHDLAEMQRELEELKRNASGEIKELITRVDALERNVTRNNLRLHNLNSERLLAIKIEHLELSLLFNGLPGAPQFSTTKLVHLTAATMNGEQADADNWVKTVCAMLQDTPWNADLKRVIAQAESNADTHVRRLSSDERPAQIDPIELRDYAIARQRCAEVSRFIQDQRREAPPKYRHSIALLSDQLRVIESQK